MKFCHNILEQWFSTRNPRLPWLVSNKLKQPSVWNYVRTSHRSTTHRMLSYKLALLVVSFCIVVFNIFLVVNNVNWHWTPNTNLLVSVLRNRVSIYWNNFVSCNILLENIKQIFAHQHNWLGVQTPWAVHGRKNVWLNPRIIFWPLATASLSVFGCGWNKIAKKYYLIRSN